MGVISAMSSPEIIKALATLHNGRHWLFIPELRIGTGYGKGAEPRIDAWAMHPWPSKRLMHVAYEVKVSRSDFLRELRQPVKRRPAVMLSNLFYFATPPGVIKHGELPIEAGLVEVDPNGRCETKVDAPWRDSYPPTWSFVASVLRTLNLGGMTGWAMWICVCGERLVASETCRCGRRLVQEGREQ